MRTAIAPQAGQSGPDIECCDSTDNALAGDSISLRRPGLTTLGDKVIVGDDEYEFVRGRESWRARMHEYFPNDQEA